VRQKVKERQQCQAPARPDRPIRRESAGRGSG